MSKQPEVVLAINQTAEPGQCGSCHFFDRRGEGSEWDRNGYCTFRLPPTRVYTKTVWDGETLPLDTVKDSDGCDFWRSSGKTFIVSQRVKP